MKIKLITMIKAFAGRCPVNGGICLNPLCAFGCIDDL
jgi:hypothetical protein